MAKINDYIVSICDLVPIVVHNFWHTDNNVEFKLIKTCISIFYPPNRAAKW